MGGCKRLFWTQKFMQTPLGMTSIRAFGAQSAHHDDHHGDDHGHHEGHHQHVVKADPSQKFLAP